MKKIFQKQPNPELEKSNEDFEVTTTFKSFEGAESAKKLPLHYIVLGVVFAGIFSLALVYFFGKGNLSEFLSPLSNRSSQSSTGSESQKVQNPLTGVLYSPKDAPWIDNRPLAIMVNNYIDARPQSGLIYADVVYEIVAEGGITRFIPFFLAEAPEKIGPVRSTRDYYLVLVKELGDAMIMHIGWSPQALEAIETWPVRSLGRGGGQFWRENPRNVASEHTAYVNGTDLRVVGNELGWGGVSPDFVSWKFKEDSPVIDMSTSVDEGCSTTSAYCAPLEIDFWYEGDYSAIFKYNPENNSYLRYTGYDSSGDPIPNNDQDTDEQVEVKNVIVQFADEIPVEGDDKSRLSYELIGSGIGLVFMDGIVVEVTWSKADRDSRTLFYDINGDEMEFNRGKFWISIVPARNASQVTY